jgi:hypothetical protein
MALLWSMAEYNQRWMRLVCPNCQETVRLLREDLPEDYRSFATIPFRCAKCGHETTLNNPDFDAEG